MKSAIRLSLICVMVFAITFAFVGVCFAAGANIAYAAEPTVYTFTDSEGVDFVVTIVDGESCNVVYGENSATLKYSIAGAILTLNNEAKGTSLQFTIGANNKLTKYVASVIDELDAVSDDEITEEVVEEKVTTKMKEYLSQYFGESIVIEIISFAIDIGAVGAIVGIYLKYRKYRHKTIGDIENLAKEKIGDAIKEKFGDLQGDIGNQLNDTLKEIGDIETILNTLLKAFVLSQDKTSEGKLAMLELLQGKTDDKEIEEKIVEIKEDIVETQEAVEEVVDKVEGEYTDIF